MANYQIITDSGCDLLDSQLQQWNVRCVPLNLLFRGEVRPDSVSNGIVEMYDALRNGETASTSAINPERWRQEIESVLQQGQDALVMVFSSGLSTTYQSAVIAADELAESYPQQKIRVVDTLCASLGQGLLVWYACQKRDIGLSLDETADWLEQTKLHMCHWFTVDDLGYLKRGGRISAATALMGTMLKIKPVLHMDDEGHLINVSKARGRKASIDALVAKMKATALPGRNDTAFICHGDCLEDAQYLEQQIREHCGVKDVFIGYIGAVIASHSGPGTLAVFFLGEQR